MFRRLLDAPYLLLTLVPLFWAGNIVMGRHVAGHVPPVGLAWLRWVLAVLILLPFAWRAMRADWPLMRRHWKLVGVLSLTGITLFNTMQYHALEFTPALNALLIQSTGPLLIAFWSFLLNGERLSAGQGVGIGLSLLGVLTIVCRGDPAVLVNIAFNRGDVWMVAAMVVYGVYSSLLARRPAFSQLGFLGFSLGLGALLLTPAFVAERVASPPLVFDARALIAIAYVAVFPSVLAYLFFNRGIQLVGPNRAAPFFHLMPVFGSALAILFLGERPHLYHAAGYALVLAGVVTATLWAPKTGRPHAARPPGSAELEAGDAIDPLQRHRAD
ncbi:DMT family transporter [Ancylobacter dichloromethanicus]|uniref:DMT transporter permease n=1 Tax=Ancylobacter dichloromethanicus TaxID=518825 RepID=A0A9W6J6Z4_9HYPH|nr:DMT family transporter [Ancylobacter dichloromethanicus]MBS7555362.1 DMT family transporter [Ancylobacter dichloromethanicus]GLK70544.1 DMT transporter permease [Ancylobacter dichloromethanicus]